MNVETKVGLFVLLGIALLMGAFAFFTNFTLDSKGINISYYIEDGTGFRKDALIKYRGIDVGRISDIVMDEQSGKIIVRARLMPGSKIPDNAYLHLAPSGIFGGYYAELIMIDPPSGAYMRDDGTYYNYKTPFSFESMASELGDLIKSVDDIVSPEQTKEDIAAILANLRESTEGLKVIIADNQRQINNIIDNVDRLAASLSDIAGQRSGDIDAMLVNFHAMSESLRTFSDNLDKLLAAKDTDFNASLANLREITEQAKESMARIDNIAANLESGGGTLGMLLSDNETRDQLKSAVSSFNDVVTRGERLFVVLEAGGEYLTRHDDFIATVSLSLVPNDRKLYYLAIGNRPYNRSNTETKHVVRTDNTGAGNNEDYTIVTKTTKDDYISFSVQYGQMFGDHIMLRAGLFDSRIGFGIDYFPFADRNLRLTAEASDFFRDDMEGYYKVNARYTFFDHFFVQAGVDDIAEGSNRSFSIGAGVTFIDNDLKTLLNAASLGGTMN